MPIPEFILHLRSDIGNKALWLPGATAVVVREVAGRSQVLCVQRADNGHWTAISGIAEPGEEPHHTVVREALEETGVSIAVDELVWVHSTDLVTYDNGDQCRYLDHTFRCHALAGEPRVADDESRSVGWFDVDDLPTPMIDLAEQRIRVAVVHSGSVLLGRSAVPAD